MEFVVSDATDTMCPLAEKDLFFSPNHYESKDKLLYLLDKISSKSQSSKNINNTTNYSSAISCVNNAFDNSSGRILLFSMNYPMTQPGKVRREK
jgi:hypothetical protein